jgi:2-keto-3-deoxy-galactonokinase
MTGLGLSAGPDVAEIAEIARAAAAVCATASLPFDGVYRRLMADAGLETTSGAAFTEQQLADAFTEGDRRYREEPERFMTEAQHLLKETPASYGEACAAYLLALLIGEV